MAKAKNTIPALSAVLLGLLATIAQAGENGTYEHAANLTELANAGLVEVNPSAVDGEGKVAVRATAAGYEKAKEGNSAPGNLGAGTTDAPKASRAASTFTLEDAIPVPSVTGRGAGGGIYPFDTMNVGQSFFVEATAERPEPAKSLASTISSANARFKDAEGNFTKKFIVRSVTEGEKKGARVWRNQ